MKLKRLSVVVCFFMLINCVFVVPAFGAMIGDLDHDGEVTSIDARMALRYSANLQNLDKEQKKLADFDGDGNVFANDARLILRKAAKLDDQDYVEEFEERVWQYTVYLTGFYADECGGENYDTALVENIIVHDSNWNPVPNYAKNAGKSEDGIVTYFGYNVLGTCNRSVFPMRTVIEYEYGGKIQKGVVLDNNGDQNFGRSRYTFDQLFCTYQEAMAFENHYIGSEPWPTARVRIIGKMDIRTGEVS